MALLAVGKGSLEGFSKEELCATPALISAKVSPDGNWIASVGADENGIPNVFLMSREGDFSSAEQISFFETPEIIQFFWSGKSDQVLVLKDEEGTALHRLYGIDIHSKQQRFFTKDFDRANAKIIQISSNQNRAVVGLNQRKASFHDLYLLDFDTGNFTLLFQNDVYAKFLVGPDLDVILKMRINEEGSWTVFKSDDTIFLELSAEEAFQTEFLSYKEGFVYFLDNRFSDTNQLVRKKLEDGKEEILGSDVRSDIDEVLFLQGEPKAYAIYYTEKEWRCIDPSMEKEIAFLTKSAGRNFEVVSRSQNGEIWVISNSFPERGGRFWIYERSHQKLLPLFPFEDRAFAKMYPMVAVARDGRKLVCYYTLPPELDKGGFVDAPIPLVVVPHGGPFKVRDKFEFKPFHQWLASCGYAVLSVNFRLSSGFGKEHVNAGNGEWGGKAHLDVIDAVEACIDRGITEKGKLAILGGSYGGYETLASLTFTPTYFTCCVSVCGPSSLKTFLDFAPQFWEFTSKPLSDSNMFFTRKAFITSFGGDPETEEGLACLKKSSPLYHLEKIQAPLLLVQGKNDHIITEIEAEQIYRNMKENGKKVTYLLFPGEGHRFANFANKMMYLSHAEAFLAEYLGGHCSKTDSKLLAESTAIVLE